MKNTNRGPTGMERCPYLGLHDDSSTSLAYPSAWNYCYRAIPAASIVISHQTETCLCRSYLDCAVYRSNKWERLPASLRGRVRAQLPKSRSSNWRHWIGLLLLLLLIVLLAVLWGQRVLPLAGNRVDLTNTSASLPGTPAPLHANEVVAASGMTMVMPLNTENPSGIAESTDSAGPVTIRTKPSSGTSPAETIVLPSTPGLAFTSTPEGACGHALDTPFGDDVKFLVHRVAQGENLTLYARQYKTSTNAILAVNYDLPMPIWEDRILVIPLETVDVSDVPAFEPYAAMGTRISLDELARQLDADPEALYRYNAFEGVCRIFSGWLLVPR